MDATETQDYERDGFVVLRTARFTATEVEALVADAGARAAERPEGTVYEPDGVTPRALHGLHRSSAVMAALVREPRLKAIGRAILREAFYVFQFKINVKARFGGAAWPWHQDYVFWQREDRMPRDAAITIAIFLDDIDATNGPLLLIPGSHRNGVVDTRTATYPAVERRAPALGQPDWTKNFRSDLQYQVSDDAVESLASGPGVVAAMGPAGTILVFHASMVHASAANLSPRSRRIVYVTYNPVSNHPREPSARPDFLVARDATPIE